jgi:hypothetical protein
LILQENHLVKNYRLLEDVCDFSVQEHCTKVIASQLHFGARDILAKTQALVEV